MKESTNFLLIKGSRVRVPPGSPKLAETIESSDSSGQLNSTSDPLSATILFTQIPFFTETPHTTQIGERAGRDGNGVATPTGTEREIPGVRRHGSYVWERLRLLTARNLCRSEQFLALQTNTLYDSLTQRWIEDQFSEEFLIERELAALEAGQ